MAGERQVACVADYVYVIRAVANRITLDNVMSPGVLRVVWKSIKKADWTINLNEIELWHDPIDHLGWVINSRPHFDRVGASVLSGLFRPRSPAVIRGAKGNGITRPLATPTLEDGLAYRALVEAAAASLLQNTPEYAHFGRSHHFRAQRGEEGNAQYETWFEHFMRRQGALRALADKGEWIVESDISNFFSYINLDRLVAVVTERSSLGRDAVALLSQILRSFIPARQYTVPGPQGLIQGNHDASRILAHVYVDLLDEEFRKEGRDGRYSRWVDDLVVSVASRAEARHAVRRIQLALEPLGLNVHPGKTRYLKKVDWEEEHYPSLNEFLDRVEARLKDGRPVNEASILQRFQGFLRARRTRLWPRVLRRFLTTARANGTPTLRRYVPQLLKDEPAQARWLLNYLSIFPLDVRLVRRMFAIADEMVNVYDDVIILLIEYLLMAPNKNRRALRTEISTWARKSLDAFLKGEGSRGDYSAGLLVLLLFKFGTANDMKAVHSAYFKRLPAVDEFTKYAFVCLGAVGRYRKQVRRSLANAEDPATTRLAHALEQLEAADRQVLRAVKPYLQAVKRDRPERVTFRPRALPCLFYLARSSRDVRAEYRQFLDATLARLRADPPPLRDERAMALVGQAKRAARLRKR